MKEFITTKSRVAWAASSFQVAFPAWTKLAGLLGLRLWRSARACSIPSFVVVLASLTMFATPAGADPPTILVQPQDQTNLVGATVTFQVQAAGTEPLSYQWRAYANASTFTNVTGATQSSLTLSNIEPTTWRFAVVVSNNEGAVTSRLARLVVEVPPPPPLWFELIGTHPTATLTAYPAIHTLKAFGGRIYLGYGDLDLFPPVVVASYDPASNAFHLEFCANTDSLGVYREIGGQLYAPSTDPVLYEDSRDFSVLAGGVWRDSAPLGLLHVFDMSTFDGTDLWLMGSKTANESGTTGPAVFRSTDSGRTWTNLTIQSSLSEGRYYFGFPLRDRFYVRDTFYTNRADGTWAGTRMTATDYLQLRNPTRMGEGTNDFILGMRGYIAGVQRTPVSSLVTFDTQLWWTLRNNLLDFAMHGSNVLTLESNAPATQVWMASAVTASQGTWAQLNFTNVPPYAQSIEILDGVVYVGDAQGRLWAGRLDGGAVNAGAPTVVNELPDDFGRALSFDGEALAVGAPDHSGAVPLCGQVTIWTAGAGTSGTWTRTATIDPPAPSFSGWFGKYLVLKEDTLAVVEGGRDLSRRDRGSSAQVDLYERVGQTWTLRRSLNHSYAQTVALDSGWLAVGVGGTGNATNALYLYSISRGAGGLEATLRTNIPVRPHTVLSGQNFWRPIARVALEGNVCAFATVADSGFFGGPGEVQIYQRNDAGVWNFQQFLQAPPLIPVGLNLPPDRFGFSLALHNGWLAVGAPRDDTSALQAGAVHLYERTNGPSGAGFVLRQSLDSPLDQPEAAFGASVALNGSTLLVGCPGAERNAERHHGAVFVFRREPSGWENVAEITRPSESAGEFGNTVAFGSNWLAASSRFSGRSTNVADRVTLWPFGPPGGELLDARQTPGGAFELTARGEIGRAYELQAATELPSADWTNLLGFRLTTVVTNLMDTNAPAMARRFYRLAAP